MAGDLHAGYRSTWLSGSAAVFLRGDEGPPDLSKLREARQNVVSPVLVKVFQPLTDGSGVERFTLGCDWSVQLQRPWGDQ